MFSGFLGFTITEHSTVKEQKEKTKHMCRLYRSQKGEVGLKQRNNGTVSSKVKLWRCMGRLAMNQA